MAQKESPRYALCAVRWRRRRWAATWTISICLGGSRLPPLAGHVSRRRDRTLFSGPATATVVVTGRQRSDFGTELVLGLLDFLRASLGCATLEAFLGLVDIMGLEEEPVSHGHKCIINALSLVTGEHLISVNWPHPASLAELSAQRNQLEVVRTWNRPFAVAPFPGEVRTIDSHCYVDTLVAHGARVVDLFSGNGARLDLILCSLNFPVRWNQVFRLEDDHLRWTVGFHPHVTSQHIPEPVWERQSVLWQSPRCVALGEVGLDYTHDKDEWVLQKTQLVRILQTAPVNLPLVLHFREGNGGGCAH